MHFIFINRLLDVLLLLVVLPAVAAVVWSSQLSRPVPIASNVAGHGGRWRLHAPGWGRQWGLPLWQQGLLVYWPIARPVLLLLLLLLLLMLLLCGKGQLCMAPACCQRSR